MKSNSEMIIGMRKDPAIELKLIENEVILQPELSGIRPEIEVFDRERFRLEALQILEQ